MYDGVIDYGQNVWNYNTTKRRIIKTTTTREYKNDKMVKETTVVEEEVYPVYDPVWTRTYQPLASGGSIGSGPDVTITNALDESLTRRD